MGKYKSIIVRVGAEAPDTFDEITPLELNKALEEGFKITKVYQIASNPVVGGAGSRILAGAVVLTYVLYKD